MDHFDVPQGFRFAGTSSGIKKSGKPDLGLIVSDRPASCAGVFTRNQVIAAPLQISKPRIDSGRCQAILVNSGNANACTGDAGLVSARQCGKLTADQLSIAEDLVAVASTGVIGVQLPVAPFEAGIPRLVAELSADKASSVAEAIMTTDAYSKLASARGRIAGKEYRILGLAKGAGMIHPNMATMLGFVLTDAQLSPELLKASFLWEGGLAKFQRDHGGWRYLDQ